MGIFNRSGGRLINDVKPGISNDIAETINNHRGEIVANSDPDTSDTHVNLIKQETEKKRWKPLRTSHLSSSRPYSPAP